MQAAETQEPVSGLSAGLRCMGVCESGTYCYCVVVLDVEVVIVVEEKSVVVAVILVGHGLSKSSLTNFELAVFGRSFTL